MDFFLPNCSLFFFRPLIRARGLSPWVVLNPTILWSWALIPLEVQYTGCIIILSRVIFEWMHMSSKRWSELFSAALCHQTYADEDLLEMKSNKRNKNPSLNTETRGLSTSSKCSRICANNLSQCFFLVKSDTRGIQTNCIRIRMYRHIHLFFIAGSQPLFFSFSYTKLNIKIIKSFKPPGCFFGILLLSWLVQSNHSRHLLSKFRCSCMCQLKVHYHAMFLLGFATYGYTSILFHAQKSTTLPMLLLLLLLLLCYVQQYRLSQLVGAKWYALIFFGGKGLSTWPTLSLFQSLIIRQLTGPNYIKCVDRRISRL